MSKRPEVFIKHKDTLDINDAKLVLVELEKYNGKHSPAFYGVLDVAKRIINDWIKQQSIT